jgi:2-polyprenyl-3-methyl-5-hydroxy-6-metoxy-1,4-benzoquinol methylase
MQSPTLLSEIYERVWSVNQERWFRAMARWKRPARSQGFFDQYPRFFSTSKIASAPDRLNQRYRALIQANTGVISGRRVLDIASHDGRWSFAAHKAGAEYVLGIEARQRLTDAARANMIEYRVPAGKVEFVHGDVMVELDKLEPGSFDTVFCFGFLYHMIDHMALLRKIARLQPTNLVIDTSISLRPGSVIEVREEETEHESAAAVGEPGNPKRAVSGNPSRTALELMLNAGGFLTLNYYNWRNVGIKRWDDLKDYYLGKRISVTATRFDVTQKSGWAYSRSGQHPAA